MLLDKIIERYKNVSQVKVINALYVKITLHYKVWMERWSINHHCTGSAYLHLSGRPCSLFYSNDVFFASRGMSTIFRRIYRIQRIITDQAFIKVPAGTHKVLRLTPCPYPHTVNILLDFVTCPPFPHSLNFSFTYFWNKSWVGSLLWFSVSKKGNGHNGYNIRYNKRGPTGHSFFLHCLAK